MNTHVKPPKGEVVEGAPAIYAAMSGVMADLDAIGKDKKNEAQGFKYRGIDQVYNALHPILVKHNVFMTAQVVGKTREERTNAKGTVLAFTCLTMRYRFTTTDGSFVETEAEGEGMDSGDKSSNKAMAVAHKYALLQAFCIPTEDLVDPDAEVHEVKAAAPRQTQREAIHSSPAKPLVQVDEDVERGSQNWVDQEKANILACKRQPDMYMWLDENGESWTKPTTGSKLYRLQKSPKHFEEIKKIYMDHMAELNKGTK
jgi:hypothetical protein